MEILVILAAIGLGVISGIFTGLIPGIHVNLIAVLALSFAPLLLVVTSPLAVAIYLISLALTHTFLDALPSIYLGAPDEAQALNVLPGHRLLKQGRGHNAIIYTVIGSLGSLLLGILLFPLFMFGMETISVYVAGLIGYLLILIEIFMIGRSEGKRCQSLVLFLLTGVLGLLVLTALPLDQSLFPLLSGLFGISTLLLSLSQQSIIPVQSVQEPLQLSRKNMVKSVSAASGVGFMAAFLPGFSSSQAAIVATSFVGDIGDEGFLSLVGGINTANMLLSIATVYVLDKARNGAIVAVRELLGGVGREEVLLFLGVALVVGGVAASLTLSLSKIFARVIVKVNYQRLVLGIILFIVSLTIYFDGWLGLLVLLVSTALGLLCSVWGVGKNHLMGCLILPVILFFIL